MSMISEQVKHLRRIAKEWNPKNPKNPLSTTLNEAADTIESLSAKLSAANEELLRQHKYIEKLEIKITDMDRSAEDCGGWIDGEKVIEEIEKEIDGVIVKDTYSKGKNAGLRKAKFLIEEYMNHEP